MSSMPTSERLENTLARLFLALVILLPTVFLGWLHIKFELPKIATFYLVAAGIVSLWCLKTALKGEFTFIRHRLWIAFGLFVGSMLLGTIFSIEPLTSIVGFYARFSSSLLHYILLFCVFSIAVAERESIRWQRLFDLALWTSYAVALYAVLQWLGWDFKEFASGYGRATSTFGEPTNLAGYLTVLFPLGVGALLMAPRRHLMSIHLVGLGVSYLAILVTYSRSGFVATLFGLASTLILLAWTDKKQLLAGKYRLLGLLLLCALATFILARQPERIEQAFENRTVNTIEMRLSVWRSMPSLFLERPLLGFGPETFRYAYSPHRPQSHNLLPESTNRFDRAHNEFFNTAITGGALGFLLFMGIWVLSLWSGWKILSHDPSTTTKWQAAAIMGAILAFGVHIFFSFSHVTLLYLWILMLAWLICHDAYVAKRTLIPANSVRYWSMLFPVVLSLILVILVGRQLTADYYFRDAIIAEQAEDYSAAHELYSRAIEYNMVYSDYLSYAGRSDAMAASRLRDEQGRLNETYTLTALAAIDDAIALNPEELNNYVIAMISYFELTKDLPSLLPRAIEMGHLLVEREPSNYSFYQLLGVAYLKQENTEKGRAMLERAMELKPDFALGLQNLVTSYQSTGEIDQARKYAKRWLTLDPDSEEAKRVLEEMAPKTLLTIAPFTH